MSLESKNIDKENFSSMRNESLRWDIIDWIRDTSKNETEKGKKFERASKFFLTNSPLWINRLSKVWLWDDPENPMNKGKDIGIDIVAKDKYDHSYWAIQCKCYDETTTLDYRDVSTFYGTTGADIEQYKHNMIITTCENFSSHLETIATKWQTVRILPSEMLKSEIDWNAFKEGKTATDREIYEPRNDQKDAIKACLKGFENADRGKLIMACGTGKTLTSLRLAEQLCPKGLVLFLAPSISLVSQTLNNWAEQARNPIKCAVVCSDKKASKTNKDTWQSSLSDIPYPATTDPDDLLSQLSQNDNKDGLTVIFSTYQSIDVIIEAQKNGLYNFNLCICDEAHRTTGARELKESKENESAFTKVHDSKQLKADKRLYMTATPRIYGDKAKKIAREENFEISSMDDEEKYGKEFYRLAFDKAVELGLLSDYRVLVLSVSEDFVSNLYQKSMFEDEEGFGIPEAAKVLGCWKGLATKGINTKIKGLKKDTIDKESINYYSVSLNNPMKRAVAFTQQIKESEQLKNQFKHVMDVYKEKTGESFPLNIDIDHVDGTQSADLRKKKLHWLGDEPEKNTCRILSNAKCLSEGIDVPNLDAILFMKPRKSKIDIVQAVGRVMRKAPGKEYGYIILPVVIPSGMTPEDALNDNKTFEVVWQVLQGLRSHDERLEAEINALQFETNDKGTKRIIIDTVTDEEQKPTLFETVFESNIDKWQDALEVKLVKKCGTRVYWDDWAEDVADIAKRHIKRITELVENDQKSETEFNKFLKGLQDSLNPSVSKKDAIEMLAQHMITLPIFEALFGNASFVKSNPVSIAMEKMLDVLQRHHIEEREDDIKLHSLYDSVKRRVAFIESDAGRQKLIKELYEKFFSYAFKSTSQKMGIVYTPNEIVDYILYTTDRMLKKEFGEGLGSKNVHILDPFAGTGTFMANLISSDIISDEDIEYKYEHEMHSNEILLLAYYIMVINIEQAYHNRVGGEYKEFKGAVLTDTFQMTEEGDALDLEIFTQNSDRVVAQNKLPIKVIVGNPPYSVGQSSANDNNQNETYPTLDKSIANTYGHYSNSTLQRNLYDSYIRAFRWASDRVNKAGIVCFVTNGGWLEAQAMDGMRKCLTDEFSSIYVFHLRGNQRTQGEESRKEGGKVFGSGSRAPIAITMLVKNSNSKEKGKIYFKDIGDYLTRDKKLSIIKKHINNPIEDWKQIIPDRHNDWLNQRDEAWYDFAPIAIENQLKISKKNHSKMFGIFRGFSLGVSTSRDPWVYNYNKLSLAKNTAKTIDYFNKNIETFKNLKPSKNEKFDSKRISWSANFSKYASKLKIIDFNEESIIESSYRPFCKQFLYSDNDLIERPAHLKKIFIKNEDNICIATSNGNNPSCLISNKYVNLHYIGDTQCFPLHYYTINNEMGGLFSDDKTLTKHDSITDTSLKKFNEIYPHAFISSDKDNRNNKAKPRSEKDGGIELNKEDIFYYIYGILHSPEYRKRFASNLKKELPRIPFAQDFVAFSKAGRSLADLHLNYESIESWAAITEEGDSKNPGKTVKMRFGKCAKTNDNPKGVDMSIIHVSENLTLKNIPLQAYDYVVNGKSAIGWIMDRYQIRTDKASGIVNDPNEYSDNPRYIVDLLKSIVTVSIRTNEIVAELPPLNELPQPANWPFEWKVQE